MGTTMAKQDSPTRSIDWPAMLVFPVLAGGGMVAGGLLISAGHRPELVVSVFTVVVAVALTGLERIMPHQRVWNTSQGDIRTDAIHTGVSMILLPEVVRALIFGALTVASAWLAGRFGSSLWPGTWPLGVQVCLALVVGEFGGYWSHRLMHRVPVLWRLHAVHHSAPRLYWLNAGRFHPLDTLFSWVCGVPILVVLGCGAEPIALFLLFTSLHGMFQHANVRMKLGPLNWIFSMSELHRWHHSQTIDESNTNFGANLIVWDIVFGTRFLPKDREPPADIGIVDLPKFPKGYLAQLASPFRWKKTLEDSR